ncbi:hypothetical protein [Tropicibacter sp. S64]|uniref:hypothetical protein n=1 Tax=Tropicibacter sp. S64 TaxID=3415122 RepID=UPI003C7D2AB3
MMTRLIPATLALFAAMAPLSLAAAAEGARLSADDFLAKVNKTAESAGKAQAPVACAGLVAALRIAAPDGSNAKDTFRTLEEEMVFYAMMTRREAAGEEQQAAMDFTVPLVQKVSAVYLERFQQNKEADGKLLDSAVRTNFGFCEKMRDEMKAALEQ